MLTFAKVFDIKIYAQVSVSNGIMSDGNDCLVRTGHHQPDGFLGFCDR
jgi:hypothetical protein